MRYSTSEKLEIIRLAEAAGDFFPDVIDAILPYLSSASRLRSIRYLFETDSGNKKIQIPTEFPNHSLKLLHAIVPDDPRYAPYELGKVVDLIADTAPELRQDHRWIRLHEIASRV